jgi:hypothetical protein
MYSIALIQNQSEMVHYGYADARPLIKELGYETELYTADNIDNLGAALTRNQYDAIILGSNALNDKTIKAEFEKSDFVVALDAWLQGNNGRGLLCLHQLRLAGEKDSTLRFLPKPLNKIAAKKRPSTETSANGDIGFGSKGETNILSLYPNRIEPERIRKDSLGYKSLPGLYWHYWFDVNLSDWEVIFVDPSRPEDKRALIINSREPENGRIVLSALTLDWQKQRAILQNILTYVVEGWHNTAFLSNQNNRNTAFDYLIGTLQSKKYPFKNYFIGQELETLKQHITNCVHNILVLGPFVESNKLPPNLSNVINENVQKGNLKLISIEGTGTGSSRFSVSGRERSALRLLHTAELQIQSELRTGYIDGSFWSTAETLQILQGLRESHSDYNTLVGEALSLASEHNRNGSYDEVFGVSCAFLWMRGTYLGVNSDETIESVRWVRERVSDYEAREQVQAYMTLNALGVATTEEKESITNILTRISTEQLSEIDIVVYLKSALIADNRSILPSLIAALENTQRENGSWVDLATTATAISILIDVLIIMRSGAPDYSRLKSNIESMIFKGIIHIQNSLQYTVFGPKSHSYPWDGKASTTAKCIQAWLKFEELIDLPVYELVETLTKYDVQISNLSSGRQALSILEDIKKDNSELAVKLEEEKEKYISEFKIASSSRKYLVVASLSTYLLISVIIGSWHSFGLDQFLSIIKTSFIDDAWAVHLAVFATVGTFLALPIRKWLRERREVGN